MKLGTVGLIAACASLLGGTALAGDWTWTGFVATLIASLGLWEGIAVKTGKMTLTNRFRNMNMKGKASITTSILGFMGWLMYHLWFE